jgi:hypothetical protein
MVLAGFRVFNLRRFQDSHISVHQSVHHFNSTIIEHSRISDSLQIYSMMAGMLNNAYVSWRLLVAESEGQCGFPLPC